jgi:hypothetical protein
MTTTEKNLSEKKQLSVPKQDDKTRSLESGKTSEVATSTASVTLSKNLAESLMGLIKDVNKGGVTPETVNASCNAAAQIYKILRLNYDMKKEGF